MKQKLLFIILLVGLGYGSLLAQNVTVVQNQSELRRIFNSIERQTSLSFVYNDDIVDDSKQVSINAKDEELSELLSTLFSGSGIGFQIGSKSIYLLDEKSSEDQTSRAISGRVVDESGSSIVGATVELIDNGTPTSMAVSTNIKGEFSLRAKPRQTLLISYIGCKTKEIMVGTSTSYSISLQSDTQDMDEVVVVAYGTQKKENLTGSISTIGSDEIDKRPVVSMSTALQGAAPGVTVTTQSGAPGADSGSIRIRGVNSFGGSSTSPLVLIDGIEDSINSIDPNLIESITVLKDAASASIYGSRAANGVILITTKRGGDSRFELTYKGYIGVQRPTDLPENVDAYQYRQLVNEMDANDGRDATYDEESMALYLKNMGKDNDLYPNTDWQEAVLDGSGVLTGHTVSLASSTDQVKMRTTFGYVDQEGIISSATFNRYSFRNNADVKFNEKLSLKLDISFSSSVRNYSPYQSTAFNYMNTRSADITNVFSSGLYNGLGLQGLNPVALLAEGGNNKNTVLRFSGGATLKYQPVEWLTLEGMLAPRYATTNNHNYKKPVTTYQSADGESTLTSTTFATLTESARRSLYGNYNFLISADKSFNNNNFKLTLGSERNTFDTDYVMAYRENFNYDYDQITAGEIENMDNDGYTYAWDVLSYFGRINYNFKERYLFEANMRIDGSSRFTNENRWGYFPSVSAAWRLSEESFMDGIKHIANNVKFRASYGTLGNQELSGSDAESYYPTTQNLAVGQISMNDNIYSLTTLNTLANEDIKWETTTVIDAGIDISLLDKFDISADWYHKTTDDILMTLDIPLGVGLNAPYQNAGTVTNVGWELSVGYRDRKGDFSWGVQANLSDVVNTIENMNGLTSTDGVMRNQEGSSIGSIYALESMGLIRTQEEADWVNENCPQFGSTVYVGDIRYKDVDGDGKITDDSGDRSVVGSTIPRYTYSLNLDFGWKNFKVSALFQGVGQVDGYLSYYYVMPGYMGGTFRTEYLDSASESNPNGSAPRLSSSSSNNWVDSSYWMKSAAYLRLKNLQVGYNLPSKVINGLGIKSAFVYLNGQNLFTLTNFWDGYDPEVGYGGSSGSEFDTVSLGGSSSANNYSQVKMFMVGIDLKF